MVLLLRANTCTHAHSALQDKTKYKAQANFTPFKNKSKERIN